MGRFSGKVLPPFSIVSYPARACPPPSSAAVVRRRRALDRVQVAQLVPPHLRLSGQAHHEVERAAQALRIAAQSGQEHVGALLRPAHRGLAGAELRLRLALGGQPAQLLQRGDLAPDLVGAVVNLPPARLRSGVELRPQVPCQDVGDICLRGYVAKKRTLSGPGGARLPHQPPQHPDTPLQLVGFDELVRLVGFADVAGAEDDGG